MTDLERKRRERNEAKSLLENKASARFLMQLFDKTGVFSECFTSDVRSTSFKLGRRSVGLEIYQKLKLEYPELLMEVERNWVKENRYE